ncbi:MULTISPECIES: hypothetical protein [unclassified Enterococcus]|uniref:TOTE conflict system archaeo-eukaryotic primase domain-containing protein n=1 Tax=unclassified Enterococcus TaxID=2608891 RepID=UPI00155639B7|nr:MULTISPECIES: hypothetical protein [unclassified Enterococcus]MBS7577096.1 hypothetical protein [Enterococcus sp. MMGLQ5-2]MBS7584457.1 hypothetical protein [Enterococcus sp. MMGLQ5-1]NPD12312.1 hypothetical protein [Enterococcus sp. MMGLQ5-1]NPD36930.1 hypothetical protein [Enterococcus sp. MMGLQ5-2]
MENKYTKQIEDNVVKQMDKLLISYRKEYLYQEIKEEKAIYKTTTDDKVRLNEWKVRKHLNGEYTLGIKLGSYGLTKFLCFDIDIMDEGDRRWTTIELIDVLNSYYGISMQDIHVWYSGMKGYHVDLYFDGFIREREFENFYYEVLSRMGETIHRIERRPTTGLGVKLPLGIHLKTEEFCYYVDNRTLEPLPIDYFLSIEPQSLSEFKENVLKDCSTTTKHQLTTNKKKKVHHQDITAKKYNNQSIYAYVRKILEDGYLSESSTRNFFTFHASRILKYQGNDLETTHQLIFNVIQNTFKNSNTRKFINQRWDLQGLKNETKRVIETVYNVDYSFSMKSSDIIFYRQELDIILSIPRKNLRYLLFSLLYHSKKYSGSDGVFYCTHATLADMGNDSNTGRSAKNIRLLEKMGFVKVISSRVFQRGNWIPNYYKVILGELDFTENDGITYNSDEPLNLIKVMNDLYNKEELTKIDITGDSFIYHFNIENKKHLS